MMMALRFFQFASRFARSMQVTVLFLASAVMVGCAGETVAPVQPLAPIAVNPPIAPVPLLENMTLYRMTGDFRRLEHDIDRAMVKEEWALLNLEERDGVYHAEGVLPDNRHGWITAWLEGEPKVKPGDGQQPAENPAGKIVVAVRVGLFGSERMESIFAARLKQVLSGKPKPKRDWSFELPEWVPSFEKEK